MSKKKTPKRNIKKISPKGTLTKKNIPSKLALEYLRRFNESRPGVFITPESARLGIRGLTGYLDSYCDYSASELLEPYVGGLVEMVWYGDMMKTDRLYRINQSKPDEVEEELEILRERMREREGEGLCG